MIEWPPDTGFPQLNSERLTLRRLEESDFPDLVKYVNNQKISEQVLNIPYPYSMQQATDRLAFVKNGFADGARFVFAIILRSENELVGEMGLHLDKINDQAQLGYWVAEPYWGQGIAGEALSLILQFGFETLSLHKIYATHFPENPASGRVMIRNRMIREGILKDHYKVRGRYRTVVQYRLTRDEFFGEANDRDPGY